MNLMFLSQVGGILKPIAWIMGIIMNAIYELVSLFAERGIGNLAICVIIFTFVTKMLMLPLTIKQQKSTKLSSKMNPEIQKIQEKYKGKKDEVSMRKQQAEMQAVYDKYGTTPMSGCLPLLITLPIMFALYRVIYAIPAYVTDIYNMYGQIADSLSNIDGYGQAILSFVQQQGVVVNNISEFINPIAGTELSEIVIDKTHLIDILYQFNTATWDAFRNTSEWVSNIDVQAVLDNYKLTGIAADTLKTVDVQALASLIPAEAQSIDDIIKVNSFLGGLNILDMPGWKFPGVVIPVLACVSQFVQSKVMSMGNKNNNNANNPDPTAQSMKMMNYVMPVMSMFICAMLPICVGLYWIASSVFGAIQTVFINRYMDKISIEELIEAQAAKYAKKKKKMGIETGSKMAEVAKTSTKSITTRNENNNPRNYKNNAGSSKNIKGEYKRSEVSYSAKSIAANANLLKNNMSQNNDRSEKSENEEE